MSWVFGPGGTTATPGGADKDIQFNNNGEFSGSNLLTTDGSGSLSASTHVSASTYYGDGSNLTGVTASAVQVADGPQYSLQFRYDSPVSGELSGNVLLMSDGAGAISASSNISASNFYLTPGKSIFFDGNTETAKITNNGTNLDINSPGSIILNAPTQVSASSNLSASNFYTNNYLYADRAYLGVAGTGYVVSRTDATTFMKMQTVGGNNSINFTLGGAKLVEILENGVDQVSLGATSGDTIHISGSLTASVGMRVSASAAIGDDIIVGAGSTRTIGAQMDGSDDFFVMGNAGGAVTLSASSGVEFLADASEGVMAIATPITVFSDLDANNAVVSLLTSGDISASANVSASAFYFGPNGRQIIEDTGTDMSILATSTPMFISADGGNLTLQNNVAINTVGVISSSQNISGSGLYVHDAFVSSVPANRVLVSDTNGQITSHSPFTFTSDVLAVPTITASVGIQTEALEVTSSANGSINIGEGISYTFGGDGRLDVFENEFKLNKTNLYQGVFPEQTSNFDIGDSQVFLVDTNSSVVTGTLPGVNSSDDYGVTFIIKDSGGNAETNNVVIEPSGSQKIDGGSAAKIETNYGAMTVVGISSSVNGLGWAIVSAT